MVRMVPAPPIPKVEVPSAYIWRRVHSLLGLWIVLFLIEHLTVNSQAALWVGDRGIEFVRLVNVIHGLPYLQVVETVLIGVPLLVHAAWGIKYLLTTRFIYARGRGSRPYLNLGRNRAYNWQRITAWLLLIGIVLHVAKFRFIDYPQKIYQANHTYWYVSVSSDAGLYKLARQLNVRLYDAPTIEKIALQFEAKEGERIFSDVARAEQSVPAPFNETYEEQKALEFSGMKSDEERWINMLTQHTLKPGDVVAIAPDFGTASLLTVRNTFKYPVYLVLYTLFVIVACFHGFNGLWTFLITWGWILKMAAQRFWITVSVGLMVLLIVLGLFAVWGTYWWNLNN